MCNRKSAYSGRGSLLPTREDTDVGSVHPSQCSRVNKKTKWMEGVCHLNLPMYSAKMMADRARLAGLASKADVQT